MKYPRSIMYVVCLLILSATTFVLAQNQAEKTDDPVVIQVNSIEVTESEVLEQIQRSVQQMGNQIPPAQREKANALLYNQVVNSMVSKSLLEDVAQKDNIKVDEKEIEAKIDDLKQQLPENMTLEMALAQQGTSVAELKNQFKEQMTLKKVIDEKIDMPKEPTEKEMKDFFENNPRYFGEEVRASHILMQFPENQELSAKEKEEKKSKLAQIRADIIADKISFEEAAQKYSEGPSSSRGGDLDFFKRGMMAPEFEEASFNTQVGDITDIVETKFGYHIIKVTDKKTPTFESEKAKIQDYLTAQEKNKAVQDYIETLKKDAKIEKKMSEEEWMKRNAPNSENSQQQQPQRSIQIDPSQLNQ